MSDLTDFDKSQLITNTAEFPDMYVAFFTLAFYGFGLIETKPRKNLKALGFLLAATKENHRVE